LPTSPCYRPLYTVICSRVLITSLPANRSKRILKLSASPVFSIDCQPDPRHPGERAGVCWSRQEPAPAGPGGRQLRPRSKGSPEAFPGYAKAGVVRRGRDAPFHRREAPWPAPAHPSPEGRAGQIQSRSTGQDQTLAKIASSSAVLRTGQIIHLSAGPGRFPVPSSCPILSIDVKFIQCFQCVPWLKAVFIRVHPWLPLLAALLPWAIRGPARGRGPFRPTGRCRPDTRPGRPGRRHPADRCRPGRPGRPPGRCRPRWPPRQAGWPGPARRPGRRR